MKAANLRVLMTSIPSFSKRFTKAFIQKIVNPVPNMAISGSSNSAVNKDMMSKIWINGGYNYLIE